MKKLTFKENMTKNDMFKRMHKTKVAEFKELPIEQQKVMIANFKELPESGKIAFECENKMLVKLQLKFPNEDVHNDYTQVSYRAITADNFDKIERLTRELNNVRLTEKMREEKLKEIEQAKMGILYNQLGNNDKGYERAMNLQATAKKIEATGESIERASQKMTRKGVKLTAMAWTPLPYLGYSVVRDAHKGKKGEQENVQILPESNNGESELVGMVKGIDTALSNGVIDKEQAKEMLNDYINNKY